MTQRVVSSPSVSSHEVCIIFALMKNLFLTFSFLFLTLVSFAQTTTVTGVIVGVDQGKSEPLAFVSVSLHAAADSLLLKATASDNSGNFSLEIASADSVMVYFNIIGFKPIWKKIAASAKIGRAHV